jgi:hypothetical protein
MEYEGYFAECLAVFQQVCTRTKGYTAMPGKYRAGYRSLGYAAFL